MTPDSDLDRLLATALRGGRAVDDCPDADRLSAFAERSVSRAESTTVERPRVAEHGDYPYNEKGQQLYPRREMFEQVINVFRKTGASVPVFMDKALSYSWENAHVTTQVTDRASKDG